MKTAILLALVALLLTGTVSAQSLLASVDYYNIWNLDGGSVSTLANGEQSVILHNQGGLGIELQPGMPVTTAFETNIVVNGDDDGSVQLSIAGDCWEKTYEIMGGQHYQHKYRDGLPLGAPIAGDGVIRHVKPGKDVEIVWVFATACRAGGTGAQVMEYPNDGSARSADSLAAHADRIRAETRITRLRSRFSTCWPAGPGSAG
jgi:hypothetical protein